MEMEYKHKLQMTVGFLRGLSFSQPKHTAEAIEKFIKRLNLDDLFLEVVPTLPLDAQPEQSQADNGGCGE